MEIKFYGASKIWHAPKWQAIRAQGFNNVARWIDIECVDPDKNRMLSGMKKDNNKNMLHTI